MLARFQYRPEPVPHLDVVQSVQLEKPVDLPVDVQSGRIFAADSDGRLLALDASTLDTVASTKLQSPASSAPYLVDGRVYVSTSRNGLACYEVGDELKMAWSVPMENASLADAPLLVNGKLVAALTSGEVLALAPADGSEAGKIGIGQPLATGPMRVGNFLVVSTIDGTLRTVESVLQTEAR
jgi:outer membrane protein assembly factor BamB